MHKSNYLILIFTHLIFASVVAQTQLPSHFNSINEAQESLLEQEFFEQVKDDNWTAIETVLLYLIESEPANPSLLYLLEQCYATLFGAQKDKYSQLSFEFFHKAKTQFLKILELNEEYYQAYHAIGALHMNKAHVTTRNTYVCFSKESAVVYRKLVEQVKHEYSIALPFLQKAEQLNPNYTPTLMLFFDYFARQNEFDLAKQLRKRVEQIENGEKFTQSFFMKNP